MNTGLWLSRLLRFYHHHRRDLTYRLPLRRLSTLEKLLSIFGVSVFSYLYKTIDVEASIEMTLSTIPKSRHPEFARSTGPLAYVNPRLSIGDRASRRLAIQRRDRQLAPLINFSEIKRRVFDAKGMRREQKGRSRDMTIPRCAPSTKFFFLRVKRQRLLRRVVISVAIVFYDSKYATRAACFAQASCPPSLDID